MPGMLSEACIEQYRRDGYAIVEGALTGEEVEELRLRAEAIAAGEVPFPAEAIEFEPGLAPVRHIDRLRKINHLAANDAVFASHARRPALTAAVTALLGPDVKLFDDQLFVKPPGGMEKTFHQDSAYFTIEPMALATTWVALDDVTLDNGCLWVVPGSHATGLVDHDQVWMVGGREDMQVPDAAVAGREQRPITMRAGDCSIHHSLLLHRSGRNETGLRRRGLATHYMSARSRWTGNPADKPSYVLVCGEEQPGCV